MMMSGISPSSTESPLHETLHEGPEGDADHSHVTPSEIAVGVVIGRASEYFDFFVYGIASVLVFPAVFFPFENRLEGTLFPNCSGSAGCGHPRRAVLPGGRGQTFKARRDLQQVWRV